LLGIARPFSPIDGDFLSTFAVKGLSRAYRLSS
jgi:hypothetical protein